MTGTAAHRWYARYRETTLASLPPDVALTARLCLADWLGCALAGTDEPVASIARQQLDELAPGQSTAFAYDRTVSPGGAAWANAVAGHALDFDDTHPAMPGHPTAVVAPATLASAEHLDCTMADVIASIAVGNEIAVRAGAMLGRAHYERGWHSTSTAGVVGAVAALAHLHKADETIWGAALGFAASSAAGLKCNFGTMAKPIHAGAAAASAVRSWQLASAGATANSSAFDGTTGLVRATTGSTVNAEPAGDRWLLPDVSFKFHAACFGTHPTIEAARQVLESGIDARDITTVRVHVPPMLQSVCSIEEPRTGLEAKFSLRHTTAMMLLDRDTGSPDQFLTAGDQEVTGLRARVEVVFDEGTPAGTSRIEVTTIHEHVVSAEASAATFESSAQMTDRLREKFLKLWYRHFANGNGVHTWEALLTASGQPVRSALTAPIQRVSNPGTAE